MADTVTSGTTTVVYKYDALGNRREEDVLTPGGTTTTTRFGYDGQNAWVDLDGSNNLVTRRLYLAGVDQLFARVSAAGTAAWYLTDREGSVRDLENYGSS